jgi:signal transduction histidine kinase
VTFEGRGGAWVRADRDRLTRVITALVDNALRFSPANGPVSVRVGVRGGEAIFSVLDHGVGIPPERQERVFERYYRAHSEKPDDRGGLGVGLDTAREIVARHGGRMWFQSEPGTGSTFLFALPLAAEEGAP